MQFLSLSTEDSLTFIPTERVWPEFLKAHYQWRYTVTLVILDCQFIRSVGPLAMNQCGLSPRNIQVAISPGCHGFTNRGPGLCFSTISLRSIIIFLVIEVTNGTPKWLFSMVYTIYLFITRTYYSTSVSLVALQRLWSAMVVLLDWIN